MAIDDPNNLLPKVMAYQRIANRFLMELVDPTPRTVNLFALRDELLREMKNTAFLKGATYEEQAAIIEDALRTIEEFFARIDINRR